MSRNLTLLLIMPEDPLIITGGILQPWVMVPPMYPVKLDFGVVVNKINNKLFRQTFWKDIIQMVAWSTATVFNKSQINLVRNIKF